MKKYIITFLPLFFSFIGTAIALRYLIPVLKSKKVGQKILDIGPRWHKDKEGTPTMGGIAFIIFISLSSVLGIMYLFFTGQTGEKEFLTLLITVLYAVLNGFIGVTDDVQKLRRKKNEGLTATEKYLLQLAASLVFIFLLMRFGNVDTTVTMPFFRKKLDLGAFWYPLALLFLTGFTNAVNLTDGLDGLCGSVSAAVALFFSLYLLSKGEVGGTLISTSIIGGMLGFLIYNLHPAKVFMGDTGSLFLGAIISGLSLCSGNAVILFIVGIVYLLEALSVIIQVLFYKLTGKRVFLMAPLHHHFERKGMSEGGITFLAVAVTVIASISVYYSR